MKILDKIEDGLLAVGLFIMLSIIFINVVLRSTGIGGISFAEEITNAIFILVTLIGTAIAARTDGHMGFSLLQDSVGPKTKTVLVFISDVVCLVFSVLLLWYGFRMVQGEILSGQTTPALGIPEAIYGSFVPISAFFMTLRYGQNIFRIFKGTRFEFEEQTDAIA